MQRHGSTQLHPGVWSLPGSVDTCERRIAAARLAVSKWSVVTGESALWLRGVVARPPAQVHLLLRPDHHLEHFDGVRFHRGRWVVGDREEPVMGFCTAPVLRGLTDASSGSGVGRLVRWISSMDRLRIAGAPDVAAYLDLRGRFPGVVALREALTAVGIDLGHSEAERRARRLLRAAGLDPHRRPFAVVVDDLLLGEIDIAFVAVRYGVEIDGPHHLLAEVVRSDKARDRRLRARGWQIDRFTVEDVEQTPQAFVNAVRRGLEAASARSMVDPRG